MRYLLIFLLFISSLVFGFTESDKADMIGVNLLKNGGIEQGLLNWTKYNNSSAEPTSGTGGSASSTLAASNSSPLTGIYSMTWNKTTANRQGEGISGAFTVPAALKNSVLTISFDYAVSSGIYADDDMRVFIYDVTNSKLIYVDRPTISNHLMPSASYNASFQANGGTSYRFLIHTYSNDATRAYTLKFDNLFVGKKHISNGSIITPWVAYTPTFTGFGTVTTLNIQSRRVGDTLEVSGFFQCGTSTGVGAQMTLGYNGTNEIVTIDTSKKSGVQPIGTAWQSAEGAASFNLLTPNSSPNNYVNFGVQNATKNAFTAYLGTDVCAASGFVSVDIKVPILGWSTSVALSENSAIRTNSIKLTEKAVQYTNNAVIIIDYSTVSGAANGGYTVTPGVGYNSGTGFYSANPKVTINETGWYFISASHRFTYSSSPTVNTDGALILHVNGAQTEELDLFTVQAAYNSATKLKGSTVVYLKAGDYIDVRWFASFGTTTTTSAGADSTLSISKFVSPQTIAASEQVIASYTGVPSDVPSSTPLTVAMPTKLIDTHNAYSTSTGIFTAPRSGMLKVSARVGMTGTIIGTSYVGLTLLNGATTIEEAFKMDFYSSSAAYGDSTFAWIPVLSGDQIKVRAVAINIAGSAWISGSPTYYHLDFEMK